MLAGQPWDAVGQCWYSKRSESPCRDEDDKGKELSAPYIHAYKQYVTGKPSPNGQVGQYNTSDRKSSNSNFCHIHVKPVRTNLCRCLHRVNVSYQGEISLNFDLPTLYNCHTRTPLQRMFIPACGQSRHFKIYSALYFWWRNLIHRLQAF